MPSWSSSILNRFVAPEITSFSAAEIPDLRDRFPDARFWLAHHFLNSVLRGSFTGQVRQLVVGIVRRCSHAFSEYHQAREETIEYLSTADPHNPSISRYFAAVTSWESFILQCSMAVDLLRRLKGEDLFKKGDGSITERLYQMGNQIKHLASCTGSGQMEDDDASPLWLTNSGLASFGIEVTFEEASELLGDLAEIAEQLQDPRSFAGEKS